MNTRLLLKSLRDSDTFYVCISAALQVVTGLNHSLVTHAGWRCAHILNETAPAEHLLKALIASYTSSHSQLQVRSERVRCILTKYLVARIAVAVGYGCAHCVDAHGPEVVISLHCLGLELDTAAVNLKLDCCHWCDRRFGHGENASRRRSRGLLEHDASVDGVTPCRAQGSREECFAISEGVPLCSRVVRDFTLVRSFVTARLAEFGGHLISDQDWNAERFRKVLESLRLLRQLRLPGRK